MRTQKNTNLPNRCSLALILAVALWAPVQSQAAEHAEEKPMMERCKAMKEEKQKMQEAMKAQDMKLTEQTARMNSAAPDKRTELLAAIVTQMVEQRVAMGARKAKMEEEMMQHMMQHMEAGKESMGQCPMMKQMKGAAAKSKEYHKEHQEERK